MWVLYKTFTVTNQDPSSLDYLLDFTLTHAFFNYKIVTTLNGAALPYTCAFYLENTLIDPSHSTAVITQQGKYVGFDDCIFSNEIIWIVLDM